MTKVYIIALMRHSPEKISSVSAWFTNRSLTHKKSCYACHRPRETFSPGRRVNPSPCRVPPLHAPQIAHSGRPFFCPRACPVPPAEYCSTKGLPSAILMVSPHPAKGSGSQKFCYPFAGHARGRETHPPTLRPRFVLGSFLVRSRFEAAATCHAPPFFWGGVAPCNRQSKSPVWRYPGGANCALYREHMCAGCKF